MEQKGKKKKKSFLLHNFLVFFAVLGMRTSPVMLQLLKNFTPSVFDAQSSADQRVAINQRPGAKHRAPAVTDWDSSRNAENASTFGEETEETMQHENSSRSISPLIGNQTKTFLLSDDGSKLPPACLFFRI